MAPEKVTETVGHIVDVPIKNAMTIIGINETIPHHIKSVNTIFVLILILIDLIILVVFIILIIILVGLVVCIIELIGNVPTDNAAILTAEKAEEKAVETKEAPNLDDDNALPVD